MDQNMNVTNEVVEEVVDAVEVTDVVVEESGINWKVVGGVAAGIVGAIALYKLVIKPAIAKHKAKKEAEVEVVEEGTDVNGKLKGDVTKQAK